MQPSYRRLIRESIKAKTNSYCPYSGIRVGAAILTKTGKIFKGSNIESASFSLTICAERVAASKAVSEGEKKFISIAIATNRKEKKFPCGACLQFLSEFGDGIDIILANNEKDYIIYRLKELLPKSFKIKLKKK